MNDFSILAFENLDFSTFYFYCLSDWKGVGVERSPNLAARDQVDRN
jgi:hypothetical protein